MTETVRPVFIGGPKDGEELPERFPPGHWLHGMLPNGITLDHVPGQPGRHVYRFEGGDYVYQGIKSLEREDNDGG